MIRPPTMPATAPYITCVLIIHLHAFPEAISLKLYFLNEAIVSINSGEFVFLTRALRLMKSSELILKSSRTKKCHPFQGEVSNSIYMETPFKNNIGGPNPP